MLKLLTVITISLLSCVLIYPVISDKEGDAESSVAIKIPSTPDCTEHPTNVNWNEILAHYDSCTTYTTRRQGAKPIGDFIRYLQHEDAGTKTIQQTECRMIQSYYRKLKFCSRCHTVDCRDCDRLMETLEDAKVLLREKRFSLD